MKSCSKHAFQGCNLNCRLHGGEQEAMQSDKAERLCLHRSSTCPEASLPLKAGIVIDVLPGYHSILQETSAQHSWYQPSWQPTMAGASYHFSLLGYSDGLTACSASHGLIAFFALRIGGASPSMLQMSSASYVECIHKRSSVSLTLGEEGTVHRLWNSRY